MPASQASPRVIRFGVFELDIAAGELRRDGLKVRLQNQPVRVLTLLLKRAGEVVPRDDFRQEIWPADTFVDFDRGLSTAINKIREALGDSADNPRFVETVPRRGYRFIAPVEGGGKSGTDRRVVLAEGIEAGSGRTAGEAALTEEATREKPSPQAPLPHRRLWVAAAVVVVFALGWLARDLFRSESGSHVDDGAVRKFRFRADGARWPSISPDGTMIAYVQGGRLLIRDLAGFEPRAIADTEGTAWPFWSPDSVFVGYVAGNTIKKVLAGGGPSTTLCEFRRPEGFAGAAWDASGSIVFSVLASGLFEVPAQGGKLRTVLEPGDDGNLGAYSPHFLPDGHTMVLRGRAPRHPRQDWRQGNRIFAVASGRWKSIVPLAPLAGQLLISGLAYSPSGHILYVQSGNSPTPRIWAQPFSTSKLASEGSAFPVAEAVSGPSVARDGTLVYLSKADPVQSELVWVNRAGEVQETIGQPQDSMRRPAISPDGSKVAVAGLEQGDTDIWIHDRARSTKTRLTFNPGVDVSPAWSPSGDHIAFETTRSGETDIYLKAADGSGEAEALIAAPERQLTPTWSADGGYLFFGVDAPSQKFDLWYSTLHNDAKPAGFVQSDAWEWEIKPSPDGRYVAYMSNESGRYEIYVRTFPEGEGKRQVSDNGGMQPKWSGAGDELFYVNDNTLMAVDIGTGSVFTKGRPQPLFNGDKLGMLFESSFSGLAPLYDVAPDGEHFVVVRPVGGARTYLNVVENWFAEFEK